MSVALRLVLACGNVRFVYDCKEDNLWICGNDSKKKETFEVKGPLEVFGFGSGDFVEGPEASDVQSDVTGRWIAFKISLPSELCILKADRRLPQHIRSLDMFNKATGPNMLIVLLLFLLLGFTGLTLHYHQLGLLHFVLQVLTYRDAISQLENAGEVNVKVSMHSLDKKDGSSEMSICSQKKVCFVLDQPKENKKKKVSLGTQMKNNYYLHCVYVPNAMLSQT